MKTAKRLLAFALAGVMALALLTGCSDSSSKARQVEEYFRYRRGQFADYQKDETLDRKLKVIARQFQPSWLNDEAGGLTNEAQNIIKKRIEGLSGVRQCLSLVWRSEAGAECAGAGGEYEAMQYGRVWQV